MLGILLLIGIFTFILVPLVADGGAAEQFSKKGLIALLAIGVVIFIPSWIWWESKQGADASVPFHVGVSLKTSHRPAG